MEYVYYTLVGLLALAGIVLVIVSLYKAVIFLGGEIDDWWDDRRHKSAPTSHGILSPNEARELQGVPEIQWAKDGSTGRIVIEKHKHHYKVIRARHDRYEFVCRKDGCGDIVEIFRTYFWAGEKDTRQLYEEAISAMREYRIESKYAPASAWQTEDL